MWAGFDRHLPGGELTRDTDGRAFITIQGCSVRENTSGITWPLPVGSSSSTTGFKNKWDGSDRRTNSVWFQCLCVHAQACPTLCDPTDWSPPGSSVHGIFQARLLEWVAISSYRGSSQTRDQTRVSLASPALTGGFLTTVPPGKPIRR